MLLVLLSGCTSKPDGSSDASAIGSEQSSNTSNTEPVGPDDDPGLCCRGDRGVVMPTPDTHIERRDWVFDRYAERLNPNAKSIRTLRRPHHSVLHV